MPVIPMSSPSELIKRLEANVGRALVGKPEVVRLAVVALLARGHLLIEDVPGVGKTTLAAALARSLGAGFQRIQFTSDMLPSDVLGVSVYQPDRGEFVFRPGPIFTNFVLADEINRTTPKTQSSLLEAMNEAQVSLDHLTYPLPRPFMLRIRIGYPGPSDEKAILRGAGASALPAMAPALTVGEILALQEATERVDIEESLLDYLLGIVSATRTSPLLSLGVSPRGSLALLRAAQAHALADGRDYLVPDDVKVVAVPALAHRVMLKGGGPQAPGSMDGEAVIRAVLRDVAVPR